MHGYKPCILAMCALSTDLRGPAERLSGVSTEDRRLTAQNAQMRDIHFGR